jgi:hypothetical protein
VWFKHRAWIPVGWLLAAANVGAIWFAALPGEALHATTHGLLAVLFAVGAQRLSQRRTATLLDDDVVERMGELEAQLTELDRLPDPANRIAELEERLDFMERALVQVRERAQLPPKDER